MSTLRAYLGRDKRKTLFASLVVFVTTLAVAGVSFVVGPFANADPQAGAQCTPIKVIAARGTWETRSDDDPNNPGLKGMLQPITDRLETQFSGKVSTYWVPYTAQAFTDDPTTEQQEITLYNDSKTDGINKARAAMEEISRQCPGTRFITLGYSQGADVVGDLAVDIGHGRGPIQASQFIAGAHASDPGRGTSGEVPLGQQPAAPEGAAGARSEGYGQLSGKIGSVCLEGDLYCAMPAEHELAGALTRILSKVGVNHLQQSAEKEVSTLGTTADGESADLSSVPSGVQTLEDQAKNGDLEGAASTVASLTQLVGPLQHLLNAIATPEVINGLLATEQGSPTHIAGTVLQGLSKVNLSQLSNELATAATAAASGDLDSLILAAGKAAAAVAPAFDIPLDVIGKATTILQGIQPGALLAQANNIIDGVTKIDFQEIVNVVQSIPGLLVTLNLNGLYQAITKIEDLLMPLAQNLNEFDFKTIGTALTMIPPVSPEAMAANAVGHALIVVDRIDWVFLARELRALQDEIDNFDISQLPTIDITNIEATLSSVFGINVVNVIRILLNLGEHALQVMDIPIPEGTLKNLTNVLLSPENVIKEGIAVAEFYASNVHVAYGTTSVDGSGRSSLDTIADWLVDQVNTANVAA